MKKKCVLTLSVVLLFVFLVGCSNDESGLEHEEDPHQLVMQIVTFGDNYSSIPHIEEAINEITIPAINTAVEIMNLSIAELADTNNLLAVSGEAVDLIVVGLTTKLSNLVQIGLLEPLDDLIDTYGQDIKNLMGPLLTAGVIDGTTYAIGADPYPASAQGVVYNQELADKLDIDIPQYPTYEDLEEIFEIIKNSDLDVYGASIGVASNTTGFRYYNDYVDFGDSTNASYGVVFNPESSTEIVNLYASDEYREYLERMQSWVEKGYMTPDSLTGGIEAPDLLRSQSIFLLGTNFDPRQEQVWTNNMGFEVGVIPTTNPLLSTESIQEVMWGVPLTSERPEKAIEFLNFMYSDEGSQVANLLSNGVEGLDYQKVSDRIITHADGVDPNNPGYRRIFSRFGNTLDVYQWEPAKEDFFEELNVFNEQAVAATSLGYTFNTQNVAAEITAVANVVAQYRPALEAGIANVETMLPEFLEALERAGISRIIEENQTQFDEWLTQQ